MPREEGEGVEIEITAVYTLDGAFYCVERGECDVRGATVVVDSLTNDVRGGPSGQTPKEANASWGGSSCGLSAEADADDGRDSL